MFTTSVKLNALFSKMGHLNTSLILDFVRLDCHNLLELPAAKLAHIYLVLPAILLTLHQVFPNTLSDSSKSIHTVDTDDSKTISHLFNNQLDKKKKT